MVNILKYSPFGLQKYNFLSGKQKLQSKKLMVFCFPPAAFQQNAISFYVISMLLCL